MSTGEFFKRPSSMALMPVQGPKRARTGDIVESAGDAPPRTSHLKATIMMLNGHEGEIYGARFSPDGSCLASVGFDMKICK